MPRSYPTSAISWKFAAAQLPVITEYVWWKPRVSGSDMSKRESLFNVLHFRNTRYECRHLKDSDSEADEELNIISDLYNALESQPKSVEIHEIIIEVWQSLGCEGNEHL